MPKISIALEANEAAHLLIPGLAVDRNGFALVVGRLSIVVAWGRAAATF